MATAAKGMVSGLFWMWIAFRDSAGYPMGQLITPNSPVNGTTYPAYLLNHQVSFTPATPTRELATQQGGQKIIAQRDLGISALGNGSITLSAYDEAFHAFVSGSAFDGTTVSGIAATSANDGNGDLPPFIIGFVRAFSNANGAQEYITGIFHNAQIRPAKVGGSQSGGTNPNPLQYDIVPSFSARTVMGRLFSATALDVVDDTDTYTEYRYTDPLFVTTFIGDAAEDEITLPYLPTTSDATGAATNSITNAGATLAVTSVSTSTGVVVCTAPPAAAAKIVLFTPTRFRAA